MLVMRECTVTPECTNQCLAFGKPSSALALAIMMCKRRLAREGFVIVNTCQVHSDWIWRLHTSIAPSTAIPRCKSSHGRHDCAATEAGAVEPSSERAWTLKAECRIRPTRPLVVDRTCPCLNHWAD